MDKFDRRSLLGLAVGGSAVVLAWPIAAVAEVCGVNYLNLNLIASGAERLPVEQRMPRFYRLLKAKEAGPCRLYPASNCLSLMGCGLGGEVTQTVLAERFLRAADWLNARPRGAFDKWSELGGDAVMEFHFQIAGSSDGKPLPTCNVPRGVPGRLCRGQGSAPPESVLTAQAAWPLEIPQAV